jgi:hypothetical protein
MPLEAAARCCFDHGFDHAVIEDPEPVGMAAEWIPLFSGMTVDLNRPG